MTAASTSTVWTAAGINITIGLAALGIAGVALTNQNGLSNTQGQQTSTMSLMREEQKEFVGKLDGIQLSINALRQQVELAQTDIGTIIAKTGVPIDEDVTWVSIGKEVVGFPKTDEALSTLESENLQPIQITPFVKGYALNAAAADAVKNIIDATTGATLPATNQN